MEFMILLAGMGGIATGLLGGYLLPGYFREKGKNWAMKEDIEQLTQTVERVKEQIARDMEVFKTSLVPDVEFHKFIASRKIDAFIHILKIKQGLHEQSKAKGSIMVLKETIEAAEEYFNLHRSLLTNLQGELPAFNRLLNEVFSQPTKEGFIALMDATDALMAALIKPRESAEE